MRSDNILKQKYWFSVSPFSLMSIHNIARVFPFKLQKKKKRL